MPPLRRAYWRDGYLVVDLRRCARRGASRRGRVQTDHPVRKDRANPNLAWATDFTPHVVKAIGGMEVLGGIGVVLPHATGIAPVLSPLAAAGLAVLQAGAFGVHVRRNEWKSTMVNVILIVLAVFVAFEWYALPTSGQ